jgi:Phage tail assembly chaperone protein, TAC
MFVEAAARLAGVAGAILGWQPSEFWRATPDELAAVLSALSPDSEGAADAALIDRLKEQFPDG